MDGLQDHIQGNREQYDKDQLLESDLTITPFELFTRWIKLAIDKGVNEPNAMTISTVDNDGQPSSRVVLMRGFDEKGIVFFTNYNSRKGFEISAHAKVALNYYWYDLNKQVRIEGNAKQAPAALSDDYFNSRPRESQIGAWASEQSRVLSNRKELEDRYAELTQKFEGNPVPRPPYWGGYIVEPFFFEFWQGRPDRLHDRFQYLLKGNKWIVSRLSP